MNPFSYMREHWIELLVSGLWLQSVVGAALARNWVVLAIASLGGLAILLLIFLALRLIDRSRRVALAVSEAFNTLQRAVVCTVGM